MAVEDLIRSQLQNEEEFTDCGTELYADDEMKVLELGSKVHQANLSVNFMRYYPQATPGYFSKIYARGQDLSRAGHVT